MIDAAPIVDLAGRGLTPHQIARQTGHYATTVARLLRRLGVAAARGDRIPTNRVTADREAAALADLVAGMFRRDVQRKYRLGSNAVARIMREHRDEIQAAQIARRADKVAREFDSATPRWCEPYSGRRCAYHDCRWPLPGRGICQPGIGNPACVRRGPRLTVSVLGGVDPIGWIVSRDYYPRPDPAVHPLVSRIADLVARGIGEAAIAREMGISLERVGNICGAGVRIELRRKALPC